MVIPSWNLSAQTVGSMNSLTLLEKEKTCVAVAAGAILILFTPLFLKIRKNYLTLKSITMSVNNGEELTIRACWDMIKAAVINTIVDIIGMNVLISGGTAVQQFRRKMSSALAALFTIIRRILSSNAFNGCLRLISLATMLHYYARRPVLESTQRSGSN